MQQNDRTLSPTAQVEMLVSKDNGATMASRPAHLYLPAAPKAVGKTATLPPPRRRPY